VATPLFWANPSATPTVLASGEFTSVSARGLNNVGQIVGDGLLSGRTTALFWASPTDSPIRLRVSGLAHGINDDGQIVGAAVAGVRIPIFLESPTSNQTVLPDGGLGFSDGTLHAVVAMDINNDGIIVGWGAGFPLLWTPLPLLMVDIDVMPGTFPNIINLNSRGNVPVAILSTVDFDATTVDPLTVTLRTAPTTTAAYVQRRRDGTPFAEPEDVNKDGLLDLEPIPIGQIVYT
jgi:hypothetical protein